MYNMKLQVPSLSSKIPLSLFSCIALSTFAIPVIPQQLHAAFEKVSKNLSRIRNLPRQPMMKVLLLNDQDGFMVEVNGAHNIYDPYTGKKVEGAFLKSSYFMYPTTDGIKWGQEFPGIFQLLVVPDASSTSVVINGIQYPGAVAFYQVEDKLAAVNWVSLEEFTSSLMSTTFLPSVTEYKEALSSYAIAIRSLAYQDLIQSKNQYWDLKADESGYKGRAVERLDKPFIDAMKVSQDIVMMTPGGRMDNVEKTRSFNEEVQALLHVMPKKDVEAMASSGKDARRILEQFFPGKILTIAESPKVPQDHPYTRSSL